MESIYNKLVGLKVGDVLVDEPMKNHTTFEIGGPCDYMVVPHSYDEVRRLVEFLRKNEINFMVIGNGSNLLVKDTGIRGVVIKIADNLSELSFDDDVLTVQAGAQLTKTLSLIHISASGEWLRCVDSFSRSAQNCIQRWSGSYCCK